MFFSNKRLTVSLFNDIIIMQSLFNDSKRTLTTETRTMSPRAVTRSAAAILNRSRNACDDTHGRRNGAGSDNPGQYNPALIMRAG